MIRPRVSRELPGGWGWKPRKPRKVHGPRSDRARRIAAELLAHAPILRLPKAALVRDIRARYAIGRATAYRVVEFAIGAA